MSFTSEVKQEIAMNELHACCVKAELSALVQMLCSINFSINGMDLRIKCEHAPTAKRIFKWHPMFSWLLTVTCFQSCQ